MLYVFSTNRVKLVARKPETTIKSGQREYTITDQGHDPVPDHHLRPGPPRTGHDPSQVRGIRS